MTHSVPRTFATVRALCFLSGVLLLCAGRLMLAAGTGSIRGQVTAAGTSPAQPVAGATVRRLD